MLRLILFMLSLFLISCNYYKIPESEYSVTQVKIDDKVLSCRSDGFCCWDWKDDQKGVVICAKLNVAPIQDDNSIVVGPRVKY